MADLEQQTPAVDVANGQRPNEVTEVEPEAAPIQNPEAFFKAEADKFQRLLKQAEKRAKDLEKADEDRKRKEDLDAGNYQSVIAQLQPKAQRADELEAVLTAYLEIETEAIPEQFRALVPDGDIAMKLKWIANAKASGLFAPPAPVPSQPVLAMPTAPITNAGEGARQQSSPGALTEQELLMAKNFGLSPEKYLKAKQQKGVTDGWEL